MKTIKIQVPVSPETIEKEIALPFYLKNVDYDGEIRAVHKVISESHTIKCWALDDCASVNNHAENIGKILSDRSFVPATEEEFNIQFQKCINIIAETHLVAL